MNTLPYSLEVEAVAADGSMRLFTYSSLPTADSIRRICIHAADDVCRKANWPSDDPLKPSADGIAGSLQAGLQVRVNAHRSGWGDIILTPRKVPA